MKNSLRQKLYDKVNKLGVMGDVLNTEVTPKNLAYLSAAGIIAGTGLTTGCAYSTNSIKNIARAPITEAKSPYVFEEFSARGEVYNTIEPRMIKVDGETYFTPCLVRRDDVEEVIDDDGRSVEIRPYNVFGLIPVSVKDKRLRPVELSIKEVDKKEKITLEELTLTELPKPQGFHVMERNSCETKYNLNRLGLGETIKGEYIISNNQSVYSNRGGNSLIKLETLPLGFIVKEGSFRILDRRDNKMKLQGYLYKPVKGKLVTVPVAGNENKVVGGRVTGSSN